jgi:hypothetical protein
LQHQQIRWVTLCRHELAFTHAFALAFGCDYSVGTKCVREQGWEERERRRVHVQWRGVSRAELL